MGHLLRVRESTLRHWIKLQKGARPQFVKICLCHKNTRLFGVVGYLFMRPSGLLIFLLTPLKIPPGGANRADFFSLSIQMKIAGTECVFFIRKLYMIYQY